MRKHRVPELLYGSGELSDLHITECLLIQLAWDRNKKLSDVLWSLADYRGLPCVKVVEFNSFLSWTGSNYSDSHAHFKRWKICKLARRSWPCQCNRGQTEADEFEISRDSITQGQWEKFCKGGSRLFSGPLLQAFPNSPTLVLTPSIIQSLLCNICKLYYNATFVRQQ